MLKTSFFLFLLLLLLSSVTAMLILPSQIPKIKEMNDHRHSNPSLKTSPSLKDSGSSAKPVAGIANATSGYLSVNDSNSNSKLFFIFHQCRGLSRGQVLSDVPLIIWIQGGSGDGAELGDFFQIGPYQLAKSGAKYKESTRKVSWNDYYNLLFIDNIRGAGYSIADNRTSVTSDEEVATDFLNALLNFYDLSNFVGLKNTPLYIFGEGFAAHFIPVISKRILNYNKEGRDFKIPFSGVGIGNGFIDPLYQFGTNGLFGFSLGLIDDIQRVDIETLQLQGIGSILNGKYFDARNYYDRVVNLITSQGGGLSLYNYRKFEGEYDFSSLSQFMNDPDTVKRYNVDPSVGGRFVDVNTTIYNALTRSIMGGTVDNLIQVLESELPVLVYNGQDDLICNIAGVQNWIANLKWFGQIAYYNLDSNPWVYKNGSMAGFQKSYKNFNFAMVSKAGHLTAYDQIDTTTEMVRRFIQKQTNWTQPVKSSSSSSNDSFISF